MTLKQIDSKLLDDRASTALHVYAEAVLREFKAGNEHHLDLWRPGWREEK